MPEQEHPFKRNKILDLLQGSAEPAEPPKPQSPSSGFKEEAAEQFIYPHINELDQVLRRFKERHSVTNSGRPAVDNTL